MDAFREAGNALLDFIYPPVCYFCRAVGAFVCEDCIEGWPRAEPPLCSRCGGPLDGTCRWCDRGDDRLRAVFACVFEGTAREAVHLLKYRGKRRVAPAMAEAMARAFQKAPGFREADAIVPMALHPARQRVRGFNQSEWLACELSALVGVPVEHWLRRTRDTGSQVGRTAAERMTMMRGAFSAAGCAGRNVALVDDVTTTGATAREAARALSAAGAASVRLVTFARDV
jgi:ComF family protein